MKRTWSSVAIVLMLAACSKGGDKGGKHGGCELAAAAPADIVTGKTPQLVAPFAALKLGMTATEVKAACPNLFEDEDDKKKTGAFSVSAFVGGFGGGKHERLRADDQMYARLDFKADKLVVVSLDIPGDIEPALTAAWSAPKKSSTNPPSAAWLDDATGIRALLGPAEDKKRELVFSTYVPLQAFIEQDPGRIPFKPQEILGKTPKELMAKFPDYVHPDQTSESTKAATEAMMADMKKDVEAMGVDLSKKNDADKVDVVLPATPFAARGETQAIFHTNDDGTIRNYGVWFRTEGWPNEITDAIALFDKLWGPHKELNKTLGKELAWYDPKLGIRASARLDPARPDELDISYVRYQMLEKVFGAPGMVFGFEKPDRPLLGATAQELVAAYGGADGKAVEVAADGNSATLTFLPTEYDDDVSTTRVLAFIRGGKVEQWNVSFGFEDFEGAKAELEALLAAKLGPAPAPDKYGHMHYGKGPSVDAEYSDITHELDLEITK
jgi:hypothetical protein